MHERFRLALLLCASLVGACGSGSAPTPPACTVSDAFETLDVYQLDPAQNSFATGALEISEGTIFVIGFGYDGVSARALIRESTDGGSTWNTTVNYGYANARDSEVVGIGEGADGTLYAIINATDASYVGGIVVAKSLNRGATWDIPGGTPYHYAGDVSTTASSLRIEGDTLYVSAQGWGAVDGDHWLVLKSLDHGVSWEIEDDASEMSRSYLANGLDVRGDILLVAGTTEDASTDGWTSRVKVGGVWTPGERFVPVTSFSSEGVDALIHPTGALFTFGFTQETTTSWLVRRSDDQGATWQTVDLVGMDPVANQAPARLLQDRQGHLYAVGGFGSASGEYLSVRRSEDLGATWQTIDTYQETSGAPARARGGAVGASGDVFVTGQATSAMGHTQWVVRRAACL